MASRTLLSLVLLFSVVGCGLCWKEVHGEPNEWPPMPVPGLDAEENPILCEACTIIVEELQSILGNDSKKIIALLEEICGELPASYVAECKEYVDEWTPIIVDFLENETPEEICQDLTLCPAAQPADASRLGFGQLLRFFRRAFKINIDKLMIRNALGNQFLCDGCNELVFVLGEELTNPQTLDELVALLSEGCSICPVEAQCRAYFQNLPANITAFVDKYLNNQTCKALGLCSNGKTYSVDMFSRIFDGIIPDDLDMDFLGRPKPNSRPRPDGEPSPRPHPARGNFRPFFRPIHRDHENRNHTRPEGREHHSWENPSLGRPDGHDWHHHHHHHHSSHEVSRPDYKPRPEGRDRPNYGPRPGGRDPDNHNGPHHGYIPEDDIPLPDVRPWWKPVMKPFKPRPSGNKPVLPEEPMIPDSIPEIPDVQIPEVEIPEVEIPEIPIDVPVEIMNNPDPRNPLGFDRQDGRPSVDNRWKPNFENRKGASPAKPFRPRGHSKGYRKGRSVSIDTVVNTDPANTFDVEPVKDPVYERVEASWECEMCEYEVDVLQSYLKSHEGVIEAKLLSIASMFCERLPSTTTANCKAEMADLIPSIVDMIIENLSTDNVCTTFNVC